MDAGTRVLRSVCVCLPKPKPKVLCNFRFRCHNHFDCCCLRSVVCVMKLVGSGQQVPASTASASVCGVAPRSFVFAFAAAAALHLHPGALDSCSFVEYHPAPGSLKSCQKVLSFHKSHRVRLRLKHWEKDKSFYNIL